MSDFNELSKGQETPDPQDNQEELSLHLTTSLLNSVFQENKKLRLVIDKLQKSQISLRDKVAVAVYPKFLDLNFKAEQAAEDALKCADAFMRIRERGRVYEDDLLESFNEMVKNSSSDTEIGGKLRMFLNKKFVQ